MGVDDLLHLSMVPTYRDGSLGLALPWALIRFLTGGQPADGLAGTLGLAPPVWVGQFRWLLLGAGHGESMGTGMGEPGASSHSLATPSAKKRVTPRGNVGSSPNSSSTSHLTFFLSLPCPVPRF